MLKLVLKIFSSIDNGRVIRVSHLELLTGSFEVVEI